VLEKEKWQWAVLQIHAVGIKWGGCGNTRHEVLFCGEGEDMRFMSDNRES